MRYYEVFQVKSAFHLTIRGAMDIAKDSGFDFRYDGDYTTMKDIKTGEVFKLSKEERAELPTEEPSSTNSDELIKARRLIRVLRTLMKKSDRLTTIMEHYLTHGRDQ